MTFSSRADPDFFFVRQRLTLEAAITEGQAMNDPAHPVLLNTWKHHAGWIRWRIAAAVRKGRAGVAALPSEMAVVGSRLMDLYTGPLEPAAVGELIVQKLRAELCLEYEPLAKWLARQGEYTVLDLPDGSRWTIRLGPADGRYLHLHPARWASNTMRVQANTLKSAVLAHALAGLNGSSASDLAVVNEAREAYLGLLPVRELTADGGLGAVIASLG
jgi:hypothetical protein